MSDLSEASVAAAARQAAKRVSEQFEHEFVNFTRWNCTHERLIHELNDKLTQTQKDLAEMKRTIENDTSNGKKRKTSAAVAAAPKALCARSRQKQTQKGTGKGFSKGKSLTAANRHEELKGKNWHAFREKRNALLGAQAKAKAKDKSMAAAASKVYSKKAFDLGAATARALFKTSSSSRGGGGGDIVKGKSSKQGKSKKGQPVTTSVHTVSETLVAMPASIPMRSFAALMKPPQPDLSPSPTPLAWS